MERWWVLWGIVFALKAEFSAIKKLIYVFLALKEQATLKSVTKETQFFPKAKTKYIQELNCSQNLPGWPSGLGKRLQTAERGFKSSPRLQSWLR